MDLVTFCARPDTTHAATYTPKNTANFSALNRNCRRQECGVADVREKERAAERNDALSREWSEEEDVTCKKVRACN